MSMGWAMSHTLKQEYSIIVSSSGSRASFASLLMMHKKPGIRKMPG
jgi:hypothetical protein